VLLAVENAPRDKRAWYGMFPQLGAPLGFLGSAAIFVALDALLAEDAFRAWGWRIPFLASAVLVGVGLWVRLSLNETPAFKAALERAERLRVPFFAVLRRQPRDLVLGSLAATTTFVLFYLMTVFTLAWGTDQLGYTRTEFLLLQMVAMGFFGLMIPLSAVVADRQGRRAMLIIATVAILVFGLLFAPLFTAGSKLSVTVFLSIGLGLMGLTYGPLGTALAELFPTAMRYTGASLTFNLAGILGASAAPYFATWLARNHGLPFVGYYLAAAAAISLLALVLLRRPVGLD
jgi:MFS family permease